MLTIAVAASVLALVFPGRSPSVARFALVASGVTIDANNLELGLPGESAREVPHGTLRSSGPGGAVVEIPLDEYFARVDPLQEQRIQDALAGNYVATDAECFVVTIETVGPCSTIVLLLDEEGQSTDGLGGVGGIAWPVAEEWDTGSGRFSSPGVHVLPRRNVLDDPDQIYSRGFLIPRGAGQLTVILASREEPLDVVVQQELKAALDSAPEGGRTEIEQHLQRTLETQGFTTLTEVLAERLVSDG